MQGDLTIHKFRLVSAEVLIILFSKLTGRKWGDISCLRRVADTWEREACGNKESSGMGAGQGRYRLG